MTFENAERLLSFCQDCEVLRLRDVKAQLQQLFTEEKTILPDVCAICDKSKSPDESNDTGDGNLRSKQGDTCETIVKTNKTMSTSSQTYDESVPIVTVDANRESHDKAELRKQPVVILPRATRLSTGAISQPGSTK